MPQLTATVFRQDPEESLASIPRHADGPRHVRFTHILNPYTAKDGRGRAIQELTFETIRIAAKIATPHVSVRCVCVALPDESGVIPPDFIAAPPLTRTVLDIASFKHPYAMPLLFDILDNGIAVPEDPAAISDCRDFIIFSNIDIHLQPHFYLAVLELVRAGYDVLDIHRRIIPHYAPSSRELPFMFGEHGLNHGGCDCIVFPRGLYNTFVRNNACIGKSYVMRGLVFNCAMHARRYFVSTTARLTFHIGNDRAWAHSRFEDYTEFNVAEGKRTLSILTKEKPAAEKLLPTLRALNQGGEFMQIVEDAAGLVRTKLSLPRLLLRKLKSARTRLLQALIAALTRRLA